MSTGKTHKKLQQNPYKDLYIYYIENCLSNIEESALGNDFLGNWVEEDCSFLFFSNPSREIVQSIIDNNRKLKINDEYHFSYEEWQGGEIKTFKVSRFLIVPPWEDIKASDREIKIILDPGVVFGTSLHPTTRDSLIALLMIWGGSRCQKVIDLGTGTGVLALGAALLGAENVLAIDINPLAVSTAVNNVKLNSLEGKVDVKVGRAENFIDYNCDLLIANIHYEIILNLIHNEAFYKKRYFILSGLMEKQANNIGNELSKYPVKIINEWRGNMIWHTILGKIDEV